MYNFLLTSYTLVILIIRVIKIIVNMIPNDLSVEHTINTSKL
jgi:hypothetical protein